MLTEPGWEVPAVPAGEPGTVAWLRGAAVRFSRDPEHAVRRAMVDSELLAAIDPAMLRRQALDRTRAGAEPGSVPVEVLAAAMGVSGVTDAVRILAPSYLPPAEPTPAADAAVARLMGAFGGGTDDLTANRIALLAQAATATARLIEVAARYRAESSAEAVARALREDPPVRTTRRVAAGGGAPVVRVDLSGSPFGAGRHACPGRAHAIALATGVVEALR